MPDFYAYAYFDPRDGAPFYIGKGQGYRARKHLHQATNRGVADRLSTLRALGLRPTIETYPCADEAAAFELERQLIARYGRECEGGPLCNILEAGERSGGFLGRKHTPETKEKIRAAMKARRLTDEHKAKIGKSNRGRPGPNAEKQARMIEARKNPEVRAKLSAAAKRAFTPERQAALIAASQEYFRQKRKARAATDA